MVDVIHVHVDIILAEPVTPYTLISADTNHSREFPGLRVHLVVSVYTDSDGNSQQMLKMLIFMDSII